MIEKIPHTRTLTVTAGQQPERIDRYITHAVLRATRNKVQDAIDAGAVLVNGAGTKANYKIRPGDVITITLMKVPPIELIPQNIPLDIRYEDDELLVVNKPAGMVTHPGFGNRDGTLVNAVLYHVGDALASIAEPIPAETEDTDDELLADSIEPATDDEEDEEEVLLYGAAMRPGIVHRLDKDTSGLMVVAKNATAHAALARQFAERTAHREYWAVAWGVFDQDTGEIEGNIARSPRDRKVFAVTNRGGKYALTRWQVIQRFEFATLVALRLATGRTHQIRVHCAHIRHPLFGDAAYGGRLTVYPGAGGKHRQRVANLLGALNRQALHAKTLGFTHPRTGLWMEFDSELPEDLHILIEKLKIHD